MQSTPYRGVPVYMNGQDYIIPSLSLRQFQEHFAALREPIGEITPDTVEAIFEKYIPIIGLAVRRNYPDVTDGSLMDWLGMDNFGETYRAVQGAAGMRPAKPGEALPAK
jgi:hypothetical protein